MCAPTNSSGKPGNLCANGNDSKKKYVKVIIDGFEYDITKWAHKHPGGKVTLETSSPVMSFNHTS